MRSGIPVSVTVALGSLVATVLALSIVRIEWYGAQVTELVPSLIVPGLIAYGFVRRHRLAWQWGRLAALGLASLETIMVVAAMIRFGVSARWLTLLALAVPFYAIGLALGRPSAREWFGLVCPACGAHRARAADFLFQKARCQGCNYEW
jgi:hypothetical protein